MFNKPPVPSASFADRLKPCSDNNKPSTIRIVAEENDFPFAQVDFIRVGSAHTQCPPGMDAAHEDFMHRLCTHVMERFETDKLPLSVEIAVK